MRLLTSVTLTLDANGMGVDRSNGFFLMVATLSAGPSVDITWLDAGGQDAGTVEGVLVGRKLHAGGEFFGIRVKGVAAAVIGLMIGPDAADSGDNVTPSIVIGHVISDAGSVVEVSNDAGNALPVTTTKAAALTDTAAVAATDVAAVLLAANAARRSFRVRNAGPDPVAIGGAAVTFAAAVHILQVDDVWIEGDAPGAAWKCICAAGKTASVKILVAA